MSIDRPGLQRLLADVRNYEVDRVIVYRLDRLTVLREIAFVLCLCIRSDRVSRRHVAWRGTRTPYGR